MSTKPVRAVVKQWFADNWASTPVYDLSDDVAAEDLPSGSGLGGPWVGLQFIGGTEDIESVGPPHCYREIGTINLHVVVPSGFGSEQALDLSESLRTALRGKTLSDGVQIYGIDPPTDQLGAAIQIEGNWHGFSMTADYERENTA